MTILYLWFLTHFLIIMCIWNKNIIIMLNVWNFSFTVLKSRYLNFSEEGATKNRDELLDLIPGVSALVWVSHHPITKELLDRAGNNIFYLYLFLRCERDHIPFCRCAFLFLSNFRLSYFTFLIHDRSNTEEINKTWHTLHIQWVQIKKTRRSLFLSEKMVTEYYIRKNKISSKNLTMFLYIVFNIDDFR